MKKLNLKYYKEEKDIKLYENFEHNNLKKFIPVTKNMRSYNISSSCLFFDIPKSAKVLIVNDFQGIKSSYLCEKAKEVTIIEFSKENAEFINKQIGEYSNYEIFVGLLPEIKLNKKFDYIFISDILEFAKILINNDNPYKALIEYFKSLLTPDGKLICEVSNKFGIKNFMEGIDENYYNRICNPVNAITTIFSKNELEQIFEDCAFKTVDFYYLVPDYKNPSLILSEKYQINTNIKEKIINNIKSMNVYENSYFDKEIILKNLIKNDKLGLFINSYMIVAGNKKYTPDTLLFENSPNIQTKIVPQKAKKKQMVLTSLNILGQNHLEGYYTNLLQEQARLKNIDNVSLVNFVRNKDSLIFDMPEKNSLASEVIKAIKTDNEKKLAKLITEFRDLVNLVYPQQITMDFKTTNTILENIFGNIEIKNIACCYNPNKSLNFENVYKNKNQYIISDVNIMPFGFIPVKYLIFAALYKLHDDYGINYVNSLSYIDFSMKEIYEYLQMYRHYKNREK